MSEAADAATRAAAALFAAGRPVAAVARLREACRLAPGAVAVWRNLALVLEQEADFDGAAEAYRQALALRPGEPALRRAAALARSRGPYIAGLLAQSLALSREGRLAEARARCAAVLRLAPRSVVARGNLAALMMLEGRLEEAAAAFAAALAGASPSAERENVRCQAAVAWLALGEYPKGFAAFEARWSLPAYRGLLDGLALPRWTGAESTGAESTGVEALAGRRLLLQAEQGFGDTLQFVRYAALCAARGASVTVRAPAPLRGLLARVPGVARAVADDAPPPPADCMAPLLSLPLAFGTTLADVPASIPYLRADPARAAAWQARLAAVPGRRVGLAWAGGAHAGDADAMAMDRRRSLDPALLAPLIGLPGISLVSLQKGRGAAPAGVVDWTAELTDFDDTAALVAGLDLVITVDTAVAHLAGGMGRPVWLLNRFDSCWRWLRGRDDSPWYPTLRQFRQEVPGDWATVIGRVRGALG